RRGIYPPQMKCPTVKCPPEGKGTGASFSPQSSPSKFGASSSKLGTGSTGSRGQVAQLTKSPSEGEDGHPAETDVGCPKPDDIESVERFSLTVKWKTGRIVHRDFLTLAAKVGWFI
ncbi:MAG: hypothetical protein O7E52_26085, partial [Candidatus Poribacteria bacterium]|nr:hypothetical protein [Candidatus Poribacteria bacterium]